LTIIGQDEAKKRDIPVNSGADPEEIPRTDNIVTQILPMRTLNAAQLSKDLSSLVPSTATLTPNESGNAIVMTGTQTQIHHVAEIIKALDSSSVSSVRVFSLRYADSKTLATVIKDVFTSNAESTRDAVRSYFRMRFGGGDEGGGGERDRGSRGGESGSSRGGSSKVTAVADDYSNSVIVSAPEDMMNTIEKLVKEVDQPVEDVSSVRVFRLKFADAGEMADLLNNLFGDENKTDENNRPRFSSFFTPPQSSSSSRGGDESARAKKQAKVSAVADRRTGSVVVTASKAMMEQIENMVKDLDSDPAKKQKVYVYSLENADPQQVAQELQDLFQTTTTQSQRQTQQQQSDALSQRQTQGAQQITTSPNFTIGGGNSSGVRGGQ
jgi:general secretion pathway protein D